ncbi:MAG: ACP S-malonyltransferase [Gallicola sp.]|nr:ACP S-malonyltransferase [Gallicola sp.]
MRIGFLYSGQGSQSAGMGKDFYEKYDLVREFYDEIELDFDLKEYSFEKPEEVIVQTRYTQPIMNAFQSAVTMLFKEEGVIPAGVCGLSIGEYGAIAAAEILDPVECVKLAEFRGRVMEESSKGFKAGMAAVLGLEEDVIHEACQEASSGDKKAEISNINCPGQIVISGEASAIEKAAEILKEKGARKVIPLKVSGPFHTTYMEEASKALDEKFSAMTFQEEKIPVYYNAIGEKLGSHKVQDLLVDQVKCPVRFQEDLEAMIADGIEVFVEIGFGGVLKGFLKRINRKITCHEVYSVESFEETVRSIKE